MSPSYPSTSAAIARLRSLSQLSIQAGWRYYDGDLAVTEAINPSHWVSWPLDQVNARDHHSWAKGEVVRWFAQGLTVPAELGGYPLAGLSLRLALLWWAKEAQIYVNGQLVQEGDLFDCQPRILLSQQVQPGETFAIALRLVSPGHDDGALMKSLCHYEAPTPAHFLEPSFVADELAVLQSYLAQFESEKLAVLEAAIAHIDWSTLTEAQSPTAFHQSLADLRQTLRPLATPIKQRCIYLLGHAHLDMAWLWTLDETWKAAERTFSSVLALQQEFPDLTFCHSTPALYEWIEQHRPELFAAIQTQVSQGKWEALGGLWIEPELNLISGEAIARHILYGQRYFQAKFGAISRFAWLPDTFGFTWQLPQLLRQGGIDYFVTQKLRWNDTTQFPYELFQWQAADGTQILSLMSAPIGEGIDPLKMASYAWKWEQQTGLPLSLWLPGVGDHGGGPTRDMLQIAQRWQRSPFFPELRFTTAAAYLQAITTASPIPKPLPVWNSELYLEFHRGCYTTHADQKQANRRAEALLYQAELWSAIAAIATGAPYPKHTLEQAWKHTLLNQFHDILPGSSIASVFVEANAAWEMVITSTTQVLENALEHIARTIQRPAAPSPHAIALIVFNALNWPRSEVICYRLPTAMTVQQVYDAFGKPITFAQTQPDELLFLAAAIPSIGYRVFWLEGQPTLPNLPSVSTAPPYVVENAFLRVEIDAETGNLSRLFDKQQQWEVLKGAGNQLQAFVDQGQYWDAWNIDPNYAAFPLPPLKLKAIAWVEQNPLRSRLRVIRQLNQSTFVQDYVLEAQSPLLKIDTQVTWQEQHILVKAAFPLNLEANFVTYEIPCGAIQRPTNPQTEVEKAKWEVPAQHWADISDGKHGVSLLNDCKYGYDATPNQLRLTLLRGASWPDPEADQGIHCFTYAIYPHRGDWKTAQTTQRGYELNLPLEVITAPPENPSRETSLPPEHSLLDLGSDSLVLMALKQMEDTEAWLLRCYECKGEPTRLALARNPLHLKLQDSLDLLERSTRSGNSKEEGISIRPWQIASFQLSPLPH